MKQRRPHLPYLAWIIPGILLSAWLLASHTGWVPDYLLPGPVRIAQAAHTYIFGQPDSGPYAGRFLSDAWASLVRVTLGFALAVALGIPSAGG